MHLPTIGPYLPHHQPLLIDLLRMNTPTFFAPSEEQDYIDYLTHHAQAYFVVEEDNAIIGVGGINYGFDNGQTARLSWDIVHPHHQGKGIGAMLTRYRIDEITKNGSFQLRLRPSQPPSGSFLPKVGSILLRLHSFLPQSCSFLFQLR
jgi:ribosomal-protein-alanine N-acetyltransferase